MLSTVLFITKRSLLKYKTVLFYKYIFVPCINILKSDQLLLGISREKLYKEEYVLE